MSQPLCTTQPSHEPMAFDDLRVEADYVNRAYRRESNEVKRRKRIHVRKPVGTIILKHYEHFGQKFAWRRSRTQLLRCGGLNRIGGHNTRATHDLPYFTQNL